MRVVLVSLLLLAVSAGCISEKPGPVTPAQVSTQIDDSNVTTPAQITTTPGGRMYRMDAQELLYKDQILRATIVADEPLNVMLRADLLVPGLHYDDGCATVGMTAERGAGSLLNVALISFYGENDMPVTVSAAGEGFVVQDDGTATAETSGNAFRMSGNFTVPAGGRIHLELGGRDSSVTDTPARPYEPGSGDGTRVWIEANVTGASHVEYATPGVVRCGMGPRQFENATVATSTWLAHSAVNSAIGLDTTKGSSLLWLDGMPAMEPDVTFEFLDQTHPYAQLVAMSQGSSGHIGIRAASWLEPFPAAGWWLADVHWPILNELELRR